MGTICSFGKGEPSFCPKDLGRGPRSRFLLLSILFLFNCCSFFLAQDSGSSEGNRFTLSGTVVNAATGAPVSRALVQLGGDSQTVALTNADGQFEFRGLPASQTNVMAQKPGFFSEQQADVDNGWTMPLMIEVGPDTAPIVVKLVPESVIEGKITSNGQPAENVPVKVISPQIVEGHKEWIEHAGATTNDEGEFRIANLLAGQYFLEVGPEWLPGGAGVGKGHEAGYEKTFYPSVPGGDAATPLVVGTGQRAEVELSLKLEPWYRIKGTVRTGEGISNWNTQLLDAWGDREGATQNNVETGEFETRAAAGNYTLRAMGWGSTGPVGSASVPITVNSDISGVYVAMGAELTIPVRIKKEESGKHPATNGSSRTARQQQGASAIQMSFRHDGFFEGGVPTLRPDQSGKPETLAVRDLRPGTFWVEIHKEDPWYVQSAQCGNVDLLRESLTIGTGAPCSEIDVVLRDDGATLQVSGSWEGEPKQAMAVLLPERAPQQATIAPVTNGNEVEFRDIAPGEYSVLLVDRPGDLEYKNPAAMSAYLSKAARVTLSAGQKATVQAELVRR